jgi:hypothetical protein
MDRYVEDLDFLRRHLRLDTVAILGHSWGGLVAMHYALRHPDRVSHMILLNTLSASHDDLMLIRSGRRRKQAPHRARLDALASSAAFRDGDPRTVAEYYRIDFGTTFKRPEDAARLSFASTRGDVLRGRAIEDRLAEGLVWLPGFTIIPALRKFHIATLVIHGENDFIPVASSANIGSVLTSVRSAKTMSLALCSRSRSTGGLNFPTRTANAGDTFMITPHCWNQGEAGKGIETRAFKAMHNPIRMRKAGIPSTWYETFHTYGCKVTEMETIYYCDNIEVGRHATLPLSKKEPFFFLINLATGGGWPVDLSRYNGVADMYVDYVRVYGGAVGAK